MIEGIVVILFVALVVIGIRFRGVMSVCARCGGETEVHHGIGASFHLCRTCDSPGRKFLQ